MSATTSFDAPDGIHLFVPGVSPGNTGSEAYASRVRDLLDTPLSSSSWAFFPAGSAVSEGTGTPQKSAAPALASSLRSRGALGGLTITSPAGGLTVAPGDTITVEVTPDIGISVDQVLVVGADGAALDDSAPFSLAFVIPAEAVGAYTIRAFGKNATTNEYFESEPVSLSIQPTATLNSIALFPSDVVLLGAGASQELSVLGQYSDGVPRRIPGTSVTFTPTNPAIVTVTSAGVIEAHSQGDSSVQASYLGHTADAAVFVAPPPPLIFVDNFESADLSWWTSVQN